MYATVGYTAGANRGIAPCVRKILLSLVDDGVHWCYLTSCVQIAGISRGPRDFCLGLLESERGPSGHARTLRIRISTRCSIHSFTRVFLTAGRNRMLQAAGRYLLRFEGAILRNSIVPPYSLHAACRFLFDETMLYDNTQPSTLHGAKSRHHSRQHHEG